MKFSYYYLPNSLVEKKMLPSDFAVAAFLYSMAQAYGNKNLYGIYVKVKQTTIAEACGISVESVARATKRLITSGVIISRERCVKANRHLSTYTYTLAEIGSRFFRVDRKAAKRLTAKELRCYCAFCKMQTEQQQNVFPQLLRPCQNARYEAQRANGNSGQAHFSQSHTQALSGHIMR